MRIDFVRHHSPELNRDIVVALPSGETDPYTSQFRHEYPFPAVLRFLLAGRKRIRRFLDVGANLGHTTLAAAAMGLESFAVEPNPAAFVLLCEAINANKFSNVRAVHAAASDRADVLTLVGDSAYGQVTADARDAVAGVKVPALRLDWLLLQHDFRPDLVKIDVEGHEFEVLRGLEANFESAGPLLIVESNTWTLGGVDRSHALLAGLEELDFELYLFLGDGSVAKRPSHVLQPTAVADYLAVPRGWKKRPIPEIRTYSIEEEVVLMEAEPLDSAPHLLHLCQAIAALRTRDPVASTRLRPLVENVLQADPCLLEFVRDRWVVEAECWLA